MANSNPKLPLPYRWIAALWGLITLIWLPMEDTTTAVLILISAGWSSWSAVWAVYRLNLQRRSRWLLLAGVLAGVSVPFSGLLFTLLKAGLHGHGFLDYTNQQLIQVVKTTPIWMLLGLLISVRYLNLNGSR